MNARVAITDILKQQFPHVSDAELEDLVDQVLEFIGALALFHRPKARAADSSMWLP